MAPPFAKPTTLKIDTVLGRQQNMDDEGPFLLSSVQGMEGVSMPYTYDVVLYRPLVDKDGQTSSDVDPTKLINTPVTIHMRGRSDTYTARRGIFQTFEKDTIDFQTVSKGRKLDSRVYRARIVPVFKRLDAEILYRVFENMTVLDILEELFSHLGSGLDYTSYVVPPTLDPKKPLPVIPYCVQYGESSLNFAHRLMSAFNLWYWFDHGQSEQMSLQAHERMVLGTDPGMPTPCVQSDMIVTWDALAPGEANKITGFQRTFVPARKFIAVSDFNLVDPTHPLTGSAWMGWDPDPEPGAEPNLSGVYDLLPNAEPAFQREIFPGLQRQPSNKDMGDQAGDRLQDEEGNVFGVQGQSKNSTFVAGRTFHVAGNDAATSGESTLGVPRGDAYLITQMSFSAFENAYEHDLGDDIVNWFDSPVRWVLSLFDTVNKEQYLYLDATTSMASAGLSNWFQNVSIIKTTQTSLPPGWPADNPYQANFLDTLVSGVGTGLLQGLLQTYLVNAPKETINNHRDGYSNAFVAVPWDASAYKIVPGPDGTKPRIYGPHLAVVISDKGVEVGPKVGPPQYGETLGRVRVRFPWQRIVPLPLHAGAKSGKPAKYDTDPMKSDRSTCWVSVAEGWAGRGFGSQFHPRVGQEVIVSFLDGDPDRPIITGRRYNADHGSSNLPFPPGQKYAPPYDINEWQNPTPTDQFRFNGIKTSSIPVPEDGKQRYHLVRYDDTYNCEQYLLRSQGRLDVTAFAHSFETTYGNKHNTAVPGTDSKGNKFGGNMFTTVGGEYDLHIGGCRYEQVDKDYELTVKGDVRADLKGDLTAVVKGNVSIAVNALTIEATEKITLKVGSSFIVIDHCAVYISGPSMVYINSGGSPDKAASVTMQNVADATLAEPGDKWNTRMTPCEHTPGGGGGRGTHTENPTPAPDCDAVVGGVSCGFLPDAGGGP
jgi:uncharacterized protein involved in type VI secretion and phage assembly